MNRQEGVTLVELLVAMTIGLITVLAGLQALDYFTGAQTTIAQRTDNAQRGRLAMDTLVRGLRSQVCPGPGSPSLIDATGTSITFVSDLGDGTAVPERRAISYSAPGRRLGEVRQAGTRTGGNVTFSGPLVNGVSLAGVEPDAARPIFGYWAFDAAAPPRPSLQLVPPLSAAQRAQVARITIAFRVGAPAGVRDSATGVTLQDEVFLRSVDPSDSVPVPQCS